MAGAKTVTVTMTMTVTVTMMTMVTATVTMMMTVTVTVTVTMTVMVTAAAAAASWPVTAAGRVMADLKTILLPVSCASTLSVLQFRAQLIYLSAPASDDGTESIANGALASW